MDGALLVNKHEGVSSFGVIEMLQGILLDDLKRKHASGQNSELPPPRKRDLEKMGHGGTLDPFATGLLAVCVGGGVKLARYFLGSRKTYEGVIRFGETTIPGDPTDPVSERSDVIPDSIEAVREKARQFTLKPYLQMPPMHSAKKKNGKALYEFAREGIEVEREAKELSIYSFEILSYEAPCAKFRVECSSGTYIRTLSKDLAIQLGTVGMLDSLNRTASGIHRLEGAMSIEQISAATQAGTAWDLLPCWVPFDRLLDGYDRAEATPDEATALFQGRQAALPRILSKINPGLAVSEGAAQGSGFESNGSPVAIYRGDSLIAVARQDHGLWGLERVFIPAQLG